MYNLETEKAEENSEAKSNVNRDKRAAIQSTLFFGQLKIDACRQLEKRFKQLVVESGAELWVHRKVRK